MIFDTDDLGRKKGLHFSLLHLHPIDAKLHHPIARQFDGMWVSSLCDSTAKGKPDIELVDMSSRMRTIDDIM